MPGPGSPDRGFLRREGGAPARNPLSSQHSGRAAGSFPSFYSNEEATHAIGYIPQRSFREAISDAYDFMRLNGLLDKAERELDAFLLH